MATSQDNTPSVDTTSVDNTEDPTLHEPKSEDGTTVGATGGEEPKDIPHDNKPSDSEDKLEKPDSTEDAAHKQESEVATAHASHGEETEEKATFDKVSDF